MPKGGARPGAGRPKGARDRATQSQKASIEERARQHADAALAALAEVVADESAPHSAKVSAATALLDRGYGKPRQAVETSGPDGGAILTKVRVEWVDADADDSAPSVG